MRFLVDANLPPGLVKLFIDAGHEAEHVADVGLLAADDAKIGEHAANAGMTIVTKDEDFVIRRRLSSRAAKVVWIRIGNATNRGLTLRLQPVIAEVLAALAAGEDVVEVR